MPDPRREQEFSQYLDFLNTLQSIQVSPRLQKRFSHSDLVQITLVKALAKADELRALSEPARRARLYTMLLNNLRDEVDRVTADCRNVDRERPLMAEAERSSLRLSRWLECDQPTPLAEAIISEDRQRLLDALARLEPQQREAIILKELHDWTLAEIAEHQGQSIGVVTGQLYRGLKEVRNLLPPRE